MELLQCTASLPGGSWQRNSCSALSHCLGALAGAPEIQPSRVLRYMGTDIYLQGTPTAPRNLPEVRAAIWKQLRP